MNKTQLRNMTDKQIESLRNKIYEESSLRRSLQSEKKHKNFIGKYFKFKNPPNSGKHDGIFWWSYYRIDGADSLGPYGLFFSKDDCDEIRIMKHAYLYMESSIEEIKKQEFEQCYREILRELETLLYEQ
jgi:hypothetical protein